VSSVGSFFSYVNDARSHEPEKILVLSVWEVFLSGVTVSCVETSLILLLKGKDKRGEVHP